MPDHIWQPPTEGGLEQLRRVGSHILDMLADTNIQASHVCTYLGVCDRLYWACHRREGIMSAKLDTNIIHLGSRLSINGGHSVFEDGPQKATCRV